MLECLYQHTKKTKKKKMTRGCTDSTLTEGGGDADAGTPQDSTSPFHVMLGRAVTDVKTLGKELFVFFGDLDVCLRFVTDTSDV